MQTEAALSKYEFIADELRQRVFADYCEGDLFLTEPMLAKQYDVSVGTIRKALALMEADRVLVRKQGKGTFVGPAVKKRSTGRQIVFCRRTRDLIPAVGDSALAIAAEAVGHFVHEDVGAHMRVIGPEKAHWNTFIRWLHEACASEGLSGLWISGLHEVEISEVCNHLQRNIPVIDVSPGEFPLVPYSVGDDMQSAVRRGTRYLIEQGCRRLAMICVAPRAHQVAVRQEAFMATCAALDAKCEVIEMPPVESGAAIRFEAHGQRSVAELMRRTKKPDGLVCTDDFIGRGVLAGLLRLGISVPEEVQVCTHTRRRDGFPEVFGLPVVCLETDDSECATVAWRMMEQILSGEVVDEPHRWLPVNVILPPQAAMLETKNLQNVSPG